MTGLRFVIDAEGVEWTIWEVMPMLRAKRTEPGSSLPPLPHELRDGWLTFQSPMERRRVAPTPSGWSEMSDSRLLEVLQESAPTRRPRRLAE
jgi:hypothetical protein